MLTWSKPNEKQCDLYQAGVKRDSCSTLANYDITLLPLCPVSRNYITIEKISICQITLLEDNQIQI